MDKRLQAGVAVAIAVAALTAGCDNSSSSNAPPSAGSGAGAGGGGVAGRVSENPTSLPGRSVATARNATRAVARAQEMSGEATPVTAAGFAWSVPTKWEKVAPANAMRLAEIKVKSDAGNGDATVVFATAKGDVPSNIERWRTQFVSAGGTAPEAELSNRTIAGTKVTLVTIRGTAKGGQPGGPAGDSPNWGMRGAIVDGPQGLVFIKFLGPEATLAENEGPWMTMVQGIRKQ